MGGGGGPNPPVTMKCVASEHTSHLRGTGQRWLIQVCVSGFLASSALTSRSVALVPLQQSPALAADGRALFAPICFPAGMRPQMPTLNGLAQLWDTPTLNTTIFADIAVDQVGTVGMAPCSGTCVCVCGGVA